MKTYKQVDWKPMTGLFDTRSTPDLVPFGGFRWVQNCSTIQENKRCRRLGFQKLLTRAPYNNQDLHDQLLSLQTYYDSDPAKDGSAVTTYPSDNCGTTLHTRTDVKQPITFLSEFTSTGGTRKLFAGTQTRLYLLNENGGNWKIIADGKGGSVTSSTAPPIRRFISAQVGDYHLFTNDYDVPFYWTTEQATTGCAMQAVADIPTLAGIALTTAKVVASWKGIAFLANVTMDNTRYENRIVWSNYQDPLNFTPGAVGSNRIAGTQDLNFGEKILAMEPMGDFLVIYTATSIWQMSVIEGDAIFSFRQVYTEPAAGTACLAYPHTLVNVGDAHFYLSVDGIYSYNQWTVKPVLTEWMDRISPTLFEDIATGACDQHVASYNPSTKEMWVSWVQESVTTGRPSQTLVFNMRYKTVDIVDHGFTAFCQFKSDPRPTIREWLLSNCICTLAELAAIAETLPVKEGTPYAGSNCSGVAPASIYTSQTITVDGITTEDYTRASADSNSLCAVLSSLEDICTECDDARLFVMASSTDLALKQYGGAYYREMWQVGTTYRYDGYASILRSGALDFGSTDRKEIHRFEAEFMATAQVPTPSNLELRVGYSDKAVEPNGSGVTCPVLWETQDTKELGCLDDDSETEALATDPTTRSDLTAEWPLFLDGKYLYWELKVDGTGGESCFSRVTLDVKRLADNRG